MAIPILEIQDLHVAYGKVEALHGLNVKVGAGQIVTVIGPNGAGKSTMLNAIAGAQVANASTRGAVLLRGVEVGGYPVEARVAPDATGRAYLDTLRDEKPEARQ